MSKEYEELKGKLAELMERRISVAKTPLNTKQRIDFLNQAYDAALVFLVQCLTAGTVKSTSALCHVLERTRLEIVDLKRSGASLDSEHRILGWKYPDKKDEIADA